jgi:hypothetical protein
MNCFVPTCYTHGYGEFGPNTMIITLCQYLCKWLLYLGPKIQARALCVHATSNNNYFECDYKTCFFSCAKVLPFKVLLLVG